MRKELLKFSGLFLFASLMMANAFAGYTCVYSSAKGTIYSSGSEKICVADASCVDDAGKEYEGQIFCNAVGGSCPDANTCADDPNVSAKEVSLTSSNEPTAR